MRGASGCTDVCIWPTSNRLSYSHPQGNERTHLLHSSYALGLAEGETVNTIRLSRDGELVMVLLQNELGDKSGRIHWVPLPAFNP